ncbi:MAG: hypothetical protein Q7R76_02035 [Candidatus Woesearchaeota archaeon]|nr:hypothetical protein [Candidatus Woesearchaeota archaeon]
MKQNKKGFGWLTFILLLALLAVVAVIVFRELLPRVVSTASQLGYIENEKPSTQYTIATLQSHKGVVEEFLQSAGGDIDIEITFIGEIHRTGFTGETCYVCVDYDFTATEKIAFADFTRGLKTHRVTARDVVENPDDAALDSIDTAQIEKITVLYKGQPGGYAEENTAGWEIASFVPDDKGGLKYDATSKRLIAVGIGTISDVRVQGREINYQLNPGNAVPVRGNPVPAVQDAQTQKVTS